MTGPILVVIGLILFLVGYFYAGVAQGQGECIDEKTKEKKINNTANYQGGIAGIVIGLILGVVGYFLSLGN